MKISGIFFAIVIIAFLLPFMVVKCGDTKLATFTGFKLVTGGEVKAPAMDNMMKGLGDAFNMDNTTQEAQEDEQEAKGEKVKPNAFAIIALLMAVIGLITALIMSQEKYIIPLVVAIVGFIAMLLIKSGVSGDMSAAGSKEVADMIKIKMQFGYFLALLAFIGAAVFAYLAGKNKKLISQEQISNIIPDKVENAFDKAKDSVIAAGSEAWNKVEETVEKAKTKIDDANLEEKFDSMVDKAKEKLDEANIGGKIGEMVDKAKDKIEDVVDKAKDVVGPDDTKKG